MMRKIVSISLSLMILIILGGCAEDTSSVSETPPAITVSSASDELSFLEGTWVAGGVYHRDILSSDPLIYQDNIIDIQKIEELRNMYDTTWLIFDQGETFTDRNLFVHKGTYKKKISETNEEYYILTYKTITKFIDGEKITEPYSEKYTKVVKVLDENTIHVNLYDTLMEKELPNGNPLVYVRVGCESQYIKDHLSILCRDHD